MDLTQLAEKYYAKEAVDKSSFQRKARLLQSIWREENKLECTTIGEGKNKRRLGSRLCIPFAETDPYPNFLTGNIREIVKNELKSDGKKSGKLYGKPRIYNDLLSSQPLCFNLFGELVLNLTLVSKAVEQMSCGRFIEVTKIQFESSPGRGDIDYLGDRSAFDVFIECKTGRGGKGFIGIEVKYHESLRDKPGGHCTRYDEVADLMKCFPKDHAPFMDAPLQQLWRDHLLSGILKINQCYDDAQFIVLYPKENNFVASAVNQYRERLIQAESFGAWTLEDFFTTLRQHSKAKWLDLFYQRYLAFEKIDDLLMKQ